MKKLLKGTFTALVTPFNDDGSVDYPSLEKLIDHQLNGKVDGIVFGGTTGEKATLSKEEFEKLLSFSVKKVNKRALVIAGTGTNSTSESLENTKIAQGIGADCALIVGPYYNKPTQDGFIQHFSKIADNTAIPLIIYNVPGRTGSNISAQTIINLSRHKNITAVKEASGNLGQMMEILAGIDENNFTVLSGDDAITLPLVCMGGHGVISVVSNEIPEQFSKMVNFALKGEFEQAKKIHYKYLNLMNINFVESNPIPVKVALSMMKLIKENFRLPLTKPSEENRKKISEILFKSELV